MVVCSMVSSIHDNHNSKDSTSYFSFFYSISSKSYNTFNLQAIELVKTVLKILFSFSKFFINSVSIFPKIKFTSSLEQKTINHLFSGDRLFKKDDTFDSILKRFLIKISIPGVALSTIVGS